LDRLDVLINAAGVGRMSSLHSGDADDWREMWEVNVLGLAIASREALKRFDPESGGHIVHVCSISGHRAPQTSAFYAATKFAVRALTDALRHELTAMKSRSRVSCISPGFVLTDFFETYYRGDPEKVREIRTRHRMLAPEDVAAMVVHILELPEHVEVHDILVRCHDEPS
jgi:NADP-dependent 3-hydroxy acid dehydrogenase YdfG